MKKKLALALALSLTLGLVACGSPDEPSSGNSGDKNGASVSFQCAFLIFHVF